MVRYLANHFVFNNSHDQAIMVNVKDNIVYPLSISGYKEGGHAISDIWAIGISSSG